MLCFASSPVYLILDMTHDLLFYGIDGVSFTCFRMSLFSLIIFLISSARKQQKTNQNKKKKTKTWLSGFLEAGTYRERIRAWRFDLLHGKFILSYWKITFILVAGFLHPSSLVQPVCQTECGWIYPPFWYFLREAPQCPEKKPCYTHNTALPWIYIGKWIPSPCFQSAVKHPLSLISSLPNWELIIL